jgi:hypothetical protein
MSQSASEPDKQPENPQPKVSQNSSGNLVGGQQAVYGNNNFQNQDNRTHNDNRIFINNIYSNDEFFELPERLTFKSWRHKFCNYIKIIVFLLLVLISWSFLGIFANQAFPPRLVKDLLKYSFAGVWNNPKSFSDVDKMVERASDNLWRNTRYSISKNLKPIEETNDRIEAEELNRIDSRYWLLSHLAEILQEEGNQFEEVFWAIRKLEEKRLYISSRLEPLKEKHLKKLKFVQESVSRLTLLSKKSKKYDQVEKILNDLVQKYVVRENVSELEIQELIEVLEEKASKIPMTQSLYNVWKLVDWMNTQSSNLKPPNSDTSNLSSIDANYPPIRALKIKHGKYHIPNGCRDRYPMVEKPENAERIVFYASIEDAAKDGRKICDNCRKKLDL